MKEDQVGNHYSMTGTRLTGVVTDVKRKPEQEGISHKFNEKEGKRVLNHTLQDEGVVYMWCVCTCIRTHTMSYS